jgi:hypothetical protein
MILLIRGVSGDPTRAGAEDLHDPGTRVDRRTHRLLLSAERRVVCDAVALVVPPRERIVGAPLDHSLEVEGSVVEPGQRRRERVGLPSHPLLLRSVGPAVSASASASGRTPLRSTITR